jgi:hypothetical protein
MHKDETPIRLSCASREQRNAFIDTYLRCCITSKLTQPALLEEWPQQHQQQQGTCLPTTEPAVDARLVSTLVQRIKRKVADLHRMDRARAVLLCKLSQALQLQLQLQQQHCQHLASKATLRAALFLLLHDDETQRPISLPPQQRSASKSNSSSSWSSRVALLQLLAEDVLRFGTLERGQLLGVAVACEAKHPSLPPALDQPAMAQRVNTWNDAWRHEAEAFVEQTSGPSEGELQQMEAQYQAQVEKWQELLERTKRAFEGFAPVKLTRLQKSHVRSS